MENSKIAVIGLGYVGFPLALAFSEHYYVIGFDINTKRVQDLKNGIDVTQQASSIINDKLFLTDEKDKLNDANIFIVTVPTDIDENNYPDLSALKTASQIIGKVLKKGGVVIYESTTYPGCTEELCVPILENSSNLTYNKDFFVGYSPERINPGDQANTLKNIKKVTSGSTPNTASFVDGLYKKIIDAGTHLAPNIKTAEASKAIENAQRDLNISFMNELSLMFDKMGIDTYEVLEAAKTKWNFLPFTPGLVGGHCIGVDPYYLSHKAQSLGYYPDVILSGRRVNNKMGIFVAEKTVKLMLNNNTNIKNAPVLILGITFKENCPDIRNTKVIDIYNELCEYGIDVQIYDPWANPDEVEQKYGIKLLQKLPHKKYKGIILAAAHSEFKKLDLNLYKTENTVVFDTKAFFPKEMVTARL